MRRWFRQSLTAEEEELWLPAHIHSSPEWTRAGEGNHFVWARIGWRAAKVQLRDSLGTGFSSTNKWLADRMCRFAQLVRTRTDTAWTTETTHTLHQTNGYDCAPHVVSEIWSELLGTTHSTDTVRRVRNILPLLVLAVKNQDIQILVDTTLECEGRGGRPLRTRVRTVGPSPLTRSPIVPGSGPAAMPQVQAQSTQPD